MSKRESFTEVISYVVPQDDVLVFQLSRIDQAQYFGAPIKFNPSNVELTYKQSLGYFKPLGPNKTLFKFIINCDP